MHASKQISRGRLLRAKAALLQAWTSGELSRVATTTLSLRDRRHAFFGSLLEFASPMSLSCRSAFISTYSMPF
jgi:hypothetical protein